MNAATLALCFNFIFINETTLPITKHDTEHIKIAANTCKRVYDSCLSSLTKLSARDYAAMCR